MDTTSSESEAWAASIIVIVLDVLFAKYVSLSGSHYLAAVVLALVMLAVPFVYGSRVSKIVKFSGEMIPVDNPGGPSVHLYRAKGSKSLHTAVKRGGVLRMDRKRGSVDLVADQLALHVAQDAVHLYSRVLANAVDNKRRSIFVSSIVWIGWMLAGQLCAAPLAVYLLSTTSFFYTCVACLIVHLALQLLGFSMRQLHYARGERAVLASGVSRDELAEAYHKLAAHGYGLDTPYGLIGIKSAVPCFRARAAQL